MIKFVCKGTGVDARAAVLGQLGHHLHARAPARRRATARSSAARTSRTSPACSSGRTRRHPARAPSPGTTTTSHVPSTSTSSTSSTSTSETTTTLHVVDVEQLELVHLVERSHDVLQHVDLLQLLVVDLQHLVDHQLDRPRAATAPRRSGFTNANAPGDCGDIIDSTGVLVANIALRRPLHRRRRQLGPAAVRGAGPGHLHHRHHLLHGPDGHPRRHDVGADRQQPHLHGARLPLRRARWRCRTRAARRPASAC